MNAMSRQAIVIIDVGGTSIKCGSPIDRLPQDREETRP
jgi:hypothetical protein